MPLKLAIVEDDPRFRAAFAYAIEAAEDMELIAQADDLPAGFALLDGEVPDVMLVDLGLPSGNGVELIRRVATRWPECDVIVVSIFGDEAHVMSAIAAGASGYLLKDTGARELTEQIRTLRAGGSPISPVIARRLLQILSRPKEQGCIPANSAGVALTPQESRVLALAAKGYSYDEVAGLMGVSRHTVMTYVKRIYRKLQVHSKTEAVYEARRMGLLKD